MEASVTVATAPLVIRTRGFCDHVRLLPRHPNILVAFTTTPAPSPWMTGTESATPLARLIRRLSPVNMLLLSTSTIAVLAGEVVVGLAMAKLNDVSRNVKSA